MTVELHAAARVGVRLIRRGQEIAWLAGAALRGGRTKLMVRLPHIRPNGFPPGRYRLQVRAWHDQVIVT